VNHLLLLECCRYNLLNESHVLCNTKIHRRINIYFDTDMCGCSDRGGVALQQVHGAGSLVEGARSGLRGWAARPCVQLEHAAAASHAEGHHEALQAGGHAEDGQQDVAVSKTGGHSSGAHDGQEGGQTKEEPQLQSPPPTHLGLMDSRFLLIKYTLALILRNINGRKIRITIIYGAKRKNSQTS